MENNPDLKYEQLIKQNELILQAVFDSAPVMMILLDENAEILRINKAGLKVFDYNVPSMLGQRESGLIDCFKNEKGSIKCNESFGCDNCVLKTVFFNTLETGEPTFKVEKDFIRYSDGAEIVHTFLVSSARVQLSDRYGVLISMDDITERKSMVQKSLQNESLLKMVFENVPSIMLLVDKSLKIIQMNKIAHSWFNKKQEINQKLYCGELLHCLAAKGGMHKVDNNTICENCAINRHIINTFNTGESVNRSETDIIALKDNEIQIRTFLVSSTLMKFGDDNLILLSLDEITERKRNEEEYLQSRDKAIYNEQRYKLLSNITFEGIMLFKDLKIIDTNRALSKMSGYTYEELIGQNSMGFLFPAEYKSFFEQKLTEDYSHPYETVLICKNSSRIPIEIESRYFNHNNERIRVAAIRDITDRKLGETKVLQAIVQTEDNERARFAQELHDGLGPILSNVQMYFEWLAEADNNSDFVFQKGLLSLKNAFSTLREISNKLSPHILHNFGLNHALKNYIESIPNKEIVIEYKSGIENQRFDSNIEIAFYRVISELINNSLKYSNARQIEINIQFLNSLLNAVYTDNGIGFDINNALKNGKGFGLLNITNRMKAIHGNISFTSEINNGIVVKMHVGIA